MPRLPFNLHKDATFRGPDSRYFDPKAPRRAPVRSRDLPHLSHLNHGPVAPQSTPEVEPVTPTENLLIAAILIILALTWFVAWMIGG